MQAREEIRLRREARRAGNYYVPSGAKLAFIIRIRGYVTIKKNLSNFNSSLLQLIFLSWVKIEVLESAYECFTFYMVVRCEP